MALSYFNKLPYSFVCSNPKCGKQFEQFLGSLVHVDKVSCPACETTIDIRESKRTGDIGLTFQDAGKLDKQALQKG